MGNESKESEPDIESMDQLLRAAGPMIPGTGMVSGVIAFCLALLSFGAVLAFLFPSYLTTPELRARYDVETLRLVLAGTLAVSGGLSLFNLVRGKRRWLGFWSFALVVLCLVLGGPGIPVGEFQTGTPYVGVDFLVLDLLGSALIFVFIEKLFGHRKEQPIFRPEWQNDLVHFAVNHLVVGLVLLAVNRVVFSLAGAVGEGSLRSAVEGLPFVAGVLLAILVADLAQYWAHRAYHEVPLLWRFHSVHHSAPYMDWIAGSRQHLLEIFLTRVLVLTPLYALGFSERVLDAYVLIVGFQAVFNHANVSVRLGPLSYVIVTPNFHHWHHSQDTEAIDRNYAAHFAFLDHLFGTAVVADRKWPDHYGVVGNYVPLGFIKQQLFPFVGSTETQPDGKGPTARGQQATSAPGSETGDEESTDP